VDPTGLAAEDGIGFFDVLSEVPSSFRLALGEYWADWRAGPALPKAVGGVMIAVSGGFIVCAATVSACAIAGQLSTHAIGRTIIRDTSLPDVIATVQNGQAFTYVYNGQSQIGYYDPSTGTFVATRAGVITTVMANVSPNYIRNLQRG
jgi:hypothetical protein